MKPNPVKGKLQLKKQAVSNLTHAELSTVKGGVAEAWTTSIGNCTGFMCCTASQTCGTQLCTVNLCLSLITTLA
ncbi:class I lanthipeptide [Ferruginibacter sp. SUN106]|uniref:class I lanthipeptide n=1 Tax=Ferruginibacter sp. SUN106 TaxID=2978348 RepID=UPI003D361D09